MLDQPISINTTLFSVNSSKTQTQNQSLVLTGCRVILPETQNYSEFDACNYYSLNNNDFEHGSANIEISCENNFANPYGQFFIACVSIRADHKLLCKIERNNTHKFLDFPHYTKVTKNGNMVFGIKYYFKTQEQRDLLLNCSSFCIDGFVAFQKKRNVFGFMCRVVKSCDNWEMCEGNSYKLHTKTHIDHLYH